MGKSSDAVIIGGGVIGCLTAYYLTRRGASVTVVEMAGVASGASGKAAGILTPYSGSCDAGLLALSPATLELHARLARELPEATGVDHGYDESPQLRVAVTEQQAENLRAWQAARRSEGFDPRWLEPSEARLISPWLTCEMIGALESTFEPTVDSFLFTMSAWSAAEASGARLVSGRAAGLLTDGGGRRAMGVLLADGSALPAGNVVVASGPWAGEAGEWLGFDVPVRPQKGQLLWLDDEETGKPAATMGVIESGCVIVPKRVGGTIVGATKEEAGFDVTPTQEARDGMLSAAAGVCELVESSRVVDHTACLRPLPADGKPLVGAAPGWECVYLATGHWSEGIHFGPVTGKWLADMILDGESEYDLSALGPARFAGQA